MKKSTFSKNKNNSKFVALAFISCIFVPFLVYLYLGIGIIYFFLKTDLFKNKKKIIDDNHKITYAKLNRKDLSL